MQPIRFVPMSRSNRPLSALGVELVDRQSNGVVVQASDGRVVDHNPAATTVLEMTPDQLVGASSLDDTWEAVTPLGDRIEGPDHPAMRVLQTGEAVEGFVMGVRTGTGSYRWLRVDSWPVDVDGEPGALTQFADITEAIEARSELDAGLERLQRHVLPPADAAIPGVTVRTRYRNVVEPLQVGGDFCDVYRVTRSRFGFFIGDAAGHDLDTVATTMVAHHTLRAAGLHLIRPGRVLEWLHRTLLASPDSVYCSAIHGVLRLKKSAGVSVEFANAGHPRPIHITDGQIVVIDGAGAIAGALSDFDEPPTVALALAPGDVLILYTDGLLESPSPRLTTEDLVMRLRTALAAGREVMDVIDDLITAGQEPGNDQGDDTAVLVFHVDDVDSSMSSPDDHRRISD